MTMPVMTSGVAPRASVACTLPMTDSEQTALSEFGRCEYTDGGDDGDEAAAVGENSPTPAENATSINRLVGLMQELTDQIATLADDDGQHDASTYREEDIGSSPEGMYQ